MGKKTKKLIRKRLNTIRENLYFRPQAVINWKTNEEGEFITDSHGNRVSTVEEYDSDWGELFFDLIYVAMAFKLGDIIAEGVESQNYGETATFFFSIYVVMNDAWYARVTYYARFFSVGLLHQVIDILEALSVAWAAAHIASIDLFLEVDVRFVAPDVNNSRLLAESTDDDFQGYNYALGFSICYAVFYTIQVGRSLEIMYLGEFKNDLGDPAVIRSTGTDQLIFDGLHLAFSFAAIISSSLGWILETTYVWFAMVFFPRLLIAFRFQIVRSFGWDILRCRERAPYANLPQHLPATIKRSGEWQMLMLGEGVLQIIIQPVPDDHATTHNMAFALCFCILALLQLTQFNNMPWEPSKHVMRRNGARAIIFYILVPFFSAGLILVGVGLKSVLKKHYKIGDPKDDQSRFVWLLCIGLADTYVLLFWLKALHPGFRNIFIDARSTLSWIGCFLASLLFLAVPFVPVDGVSVLGLVLVINIVIYIISDGTNEYEEAEEVSAKIAEETEGYDVLTEEELEKLEEEEEEAEEEQARRAIALAEKNV